MLKSFLKLASLLILMCSTAVLAFPRNQIQNIYFFGDSLTDGGFNDLWPTEGSVELPALPAGKAPTFTTFNGYTWAQYLARDLKGFVLPIYSGLPVPDTITNNSCCAMTGFSSGNLTGINYAAGGSTTGGPGIVEVWAPSLFTQVQTFLSTPGLVIYPRNDIFFIWSGANDILQLFPPFSLTLPTIKQVNDAAKLAAFNVASRIADLNRSGARLFVVMSLPNIGLSPASQLQGNARLNQALKNVSSLFNSWVNQFLGQVAGQQNIQVLYIDVYTLLGNVIGMTNGPNNGGTVVQGQNFRFDNARLPVCRATPAIYCTVEANQFVFADTLHPTDMSHRLLAMYVEQQIDSWGPKL